MILILIIILLTSCVKTEVNVVKIENDSTIVKSINIEEFPKPIEPDTTRVPIGFNPIVEDWDDSTNCKI